MKTISLDSIQQRVNSQYLPSDLEAWLKNQNNCSQLFEKLGFSLLSDAELLKLQNPEPLDFKDDATYHSNLELLKKIVFVAQNKEGKYFGYSLLDGIAILDAPVISYQDYFYLEAGTITEALLLDLVEEKEAAYKEYQVLFEKYGFNLGDFKSIMDESDKIYDNFIDPDELVDVWKKGRNLSHLALGVAEQDFLAWQNPRFGTENPTKIDSYVWKNFIYSKEEAYAISGKFNIAVKHPVYCFARFGQSLTRIGGKEIFIAGEHEDAYDPDFYIYNDVVVVNEDNTVEIYNYPKAVFPPTDFHSATLVDNKILIIGNLGYMEERVEGFTPVYSLNLTNYQIEKIETSGTNPGWIYKHRAILSSDNKSIKILGGEIQTKNNLENIDEWQLDLESLEWTRLSDKKWKRWRIQRTDRASNHFYDIRQALYRLNSKYQPAEEAIESLQTQLAYAIDVRNIEELYQFQEIPSFKALEMGPDDYNIYKISIEGVTIKFLESFYYIQVTIEGDLEDAIIKIIQDAVLQRAAELENCDYMLEELE